MLGLAARASASAICLGALLAFSSVASAGNTTHAMVVSGQAKGSSTFACATSGPQARESQFFNTGIPLPTEGYASCNLAGGIDNQASLIGPVTSLQAVSGTFNGGSSNLEAKARADTVGLGVSSKGSFSGYTDAFTYRFAEAAAYSSDVIPLSALGGSTIQLGFSIDGSATSVGSSQTLTYLNYQIGAGPIFTVFAGETGPLDRAYNPLVGNVAGFTAGSGSISGSGFVQSFLIDVSTLSDLTLNLGLFASSYPGPFTGQADNDFFSTARLTSIILRDRFGNPINFSVTGASGTIYDNNGAHAAVAAAVPESSTWLLMLGGFGLLGIRLRNRFMHRRGGKLDRRTGLRA